ncbi:MAG: ion channel [Byssovorax sp.]
MQSPEPDKLPAVIRNSTQDVVRLGLERALSGDVYHYLMEAPWSRLLLLVASAYVVLNGVFAVLYLVGGDAISGAEPGSFRDAFFFSVQTLSTIGYGAMAPKTLYGGVVVTFEAFVGLLGMAMASGLMFSKFARPTARVLFSERMVIAPRDGVPCLMLRVANGRGNDVVEASFRVSVLKEEITAEGETLRRFYDLELVRSQTPLFTLSWLGIHRIDEKSPLFGVTQEALIRGQMRFVVTLTGIDGTFAQTIHARHMYFADDVIWGARFADMMTQLPDGRMQVDYSRFHAVEPLASKSKSGADAAPAPEAAPPP